MIIPPKLKVGDKIGIISTARKISLQELNSAITILGSWGLEVTLGKNIFKKDNQYAGTVEQRSADLQSMVNNEDIKAICVQGGDMVVFKLLTILIFLLCRKIPNGLLVLVM